jgi:hypothetical protein
MYLLDIFLERFAGWSNWLVAEQNERFSSELKIFRNILT